MGELKFTIKNIHQNLTQDTYEFISGHFESKVIFPGAVLLQLVIETIIQWFLKKYRIHLNIFSVKEVLFKKIVERNSGLDLVFSYAYIKKTYQVYVEVLVLDNVVMSSIIEFQEKEMFNNIYGGNK